MFTNLLVHLLTLIGMVFVTAIAVILIALIICVAFASIKLCVNATKKTLDKEINSNEKDSKSET